MARKVHDYLLLLRKYFITLAMEISSLSDLENIVGIVTIGKTTAGFPWGKWGNRRTMWYSPYLKPADPFVIFECYEIYFSIE